MALQIDSSKELRTSVELSGLVTAIFNANRGDESIAVEWKSSYDDVLSRESSFALARAILGFANREVTQAKTAFDGVAYVVVGVEPQSLKGQVIPDSAEIMNAIRRYVGSGYPRWDVRTVKVRSVDVLILVIEPPEVGDRIALLQKDYQYERRGKQISVPAGTIFVRHPGSTERATLADLQYLQERLVAGSEESARVIREEEKKRYCSALIAEIVQGVDRWASNVEILIMMTAGDQWPQFSMAEYVGTDSGREMRLDMQLIQLNSRKVKLEIDNASLNSSLDELLLFMGDSDSRAVLASRQVSTFEQRECAYLNLRGIRSASHQLERCATELFASSLT